MGIDVETGSANAATELASIPAMDARTCALGLMFTLNSTAFTHNATPARHDRCPLGPSWGRATAMPIDADASCPGVTYYDPAGLNEGLTSARIRHTPANAQGRRSGNGLNGRLRRPGPAPRPPR